MGDLANPRGLAGIVYLINAPIQLIAWKGDNNKTPDCQKQLIANLITTQTIRVKSNGW